MRNSSMKHAYRWLPFFMLLFLPTVIFAKDKLDGGALLDEIGPVKAFIRFYLAPDLSKYSSKLDKRLAWSGWDAPYISHDFKVVLDKQNRFSYSSPLRSEVWHFIDGTTTLSRRGTINCTGQADFTSWTLHLACTYSKYRIVPQDDGWIQEETGDFTIEGPIEGSTNTSSKSRRLKVKGNVTATADFKPNQFNFKQGAKFKWIWPLEYKSPDSITPYCNLYWKSPENRVSLEITKWEAEQKQAWEDDFAQAAYNRLKQTGQGR